MKDNTLLIVGLGAVALYLYSKKTTTVTPLPGTVPIIPTVNTAAQLAQTSVLLPALLKLAPSLSNLFGGGAATPTAAQANNTMLNQQLTDQSFAPDPINIAPAGGSILYTPINNPLSSAPAGGLTSSAPFVDTSSTDFLNSINDDSL